MHILTKKKKSQVNKLAKPGKPWTALNHKSVTWIYCPWNCQQASLPVAALENPDQNLIIQQGVSRMLPGPPYLQFTTPLTPQFPPTTAGSHKQLYRTEEISTAQKRGQRGRQGDAASQRQRCTGAHVLSLWVQYPFQSTWPFLESHQKTVNATHIISSSYEVLKQSLETKKVPSNKLPASFILCVL